MASKISLNLGYKSYEIAAEDEEFAAAMNARLAALGDESGRVSPRRLVGDYLRVCALLRANRRELALLKKEQKSLLENIRNCLADGGLDGGGVVGAGGGVASGVASGAAGGGVVGDGAAGRGDL